MIANVPPYARAPAREGSLTLGGGRLRVGVLSSNLLKTLTGPSGDPPTRGPLAPWLFATATEFLLR